ncbi:MAG: 2-oxo acid dehydrogenase subunit E2 [Calditrichaeota bacterium]|nr:2-oxo acid dehydrogenase subunit E2 [Calditrichota bacterium]RQV98832.1 MAG: 2-oxo acid dehydrogenase subunit E2 [Calditrichota bacterium]
MKIDIIMPKLGESLTEGTILKWWKKEGEEVKKDEMLLEVSTDKVDSEIPSPQDGVLVEIVAQEQETVEVGNVLARLETKKEVTETAKKTVQKEEREEQKQQPEPEKPEIAPSTPPKKKKTESAEKTKEKEQTESERIGTESGRFYSPLVRTIARREGIPLNELEKIPGSGHQNRVTKNDIMSYLQKRETAPSPEKQTFPEIPAEEREDFRIFPMDNVRRKIAEHMRKSLDTSAHVYSVSECDMTSVMKLMYDEREQFKRDEGFKLTITPFILHAVVKALQDFPRVNSSLEGDKIIEKKHINLGIAVAVEKGLIVPVVKKAEEKSFRGLAREVNELVNKTRENRLEYQDIEGSTFSVTNYGIFGNIIGLPIINQPNVAILGIGAIRKRPVVIEKDEGDFIAIRSMVYISMSYDHRLIDGELGGRFMQRLVEYLERMGEVI